MTLLTKHSEDAWRATLPSLPRLTTAGPQARLHSLSQTRGSHAHGVAQVWDEPYLHHLTNLELSYLTSWKQTFLLDLPQRSTAEDMGLFVKHFAQPLTGTQAQTTVLGKQTRNCTDLYGPLAVPASVNLTLCQSSPQKQIWSSQMFQVLFKRDVSAYRLEVMFIIWDKSQNCDLVLVGKRLHFHLSTSPSWFQNKNIL